MSNVYTGKPGEQWAVTTDTWDGSKYSDKELLEMAKTYIQQSQVMRTYQSPSKDYSLAQVQLSDGSMVGMTITASPSLGSHLSKLMAETGFLYLYNDTESLIIKADRVVGIKLTKLTQE